VEQGRPTLTRAFDGRRYGPGSSDFLLLTSIVIQFNCVYVVCSKTQAFHYDMTQERTNEIQPHDILQWL
jgi:hypothetical protein